MKRYKWGGLDAGKDLYLDETVRRMCYTHRQLMADLAMNLIREKQPEKARKVLEKAAKVIPTNLVPMKYIGGGSDIARAYALLGEKQKARMILQAMWNDAAQYMRFYLSLSESRFGLAQQDCMTQMYIMQQLNDITKLVDGQLAKQQLDEMGRYYATYHTKGGMEPGRYPSPENSEEE